MLNRFQTSVGKKSNMDDIGVILFCFYVFTSYIANGVVIPTVVNTAALYLFLGYSLFYMIIAMKAKLCVTAIWFALFTLLSLVSMSYSPEKQILDGTFYLMLVSLTLMFCLSQYKIRQQMIERIMWSYSLASPIMLVILFITGKLTAEPNEGRLGEELFGNANIMAVMMMIAVLYTLWLLVFGKSNIAWKVVLVFCAIIDYYGMFLSGGRKYILVPLLFLYILLLFKRDKKGRKHIIMSTVIVAAIAIGVYLLIMKVPLFYEIIGSRMESFFSFMEGDYESADGSSKIRAQMIEMGLKKWPESPLWGHGFDSFKYYNQEVTGRFYYSHNNFVEMLYNVGLIGFVAYYWIYVKYLLASFRKKDTVSIANRAFVIAAVLSMLIYEYGAINYTSTVTIIMFYIAELMLQSSKKSTD